MSAGPSLKRPVPATVCRNRRCLNISFIATRECCPLCGHTVRRTTIHNLPPKDSTLPMAQRQFVNDQLWYGKGI
jgi:ribosomal protein L37E